MTTPQSQRPAPFGQNGAGPILIGTTPEQVLAKAQSSRTVIQDFVPLADSLEWLLGQQYLRDRGNKAFLSDDKPVPYIINNDGTLAYQAARVFFASLLNAEQEGTLAPTEDIVALELGIGVGLFARFFLDAFRDLCWREKRDYYDRFCYIAADRSERMLSDLLRYGVLSNHPGRYCIRQVDALAPAELLPHDIAFRKLGGQPWRAVFLNYLLDCLPAAVLDFHEKEDRQLHVRTCVARNIKLSEHTDLTARQLAHRAKVRDTQAMQDLLEIYHLTASEYDYQPVQASTLPYGAWAADLGRRWGKRLLHSYGAIQCLERTLPLVHDRGFILINDYGTDHLIVEEDFEHQRFSLATFVGVNFALLEEYFESVRQPRCQFQKPMGEAPGIHARLLSRANMPEVTYSFITQFSTAEYLRLHKAVERARDCCEHGRFELANAEYQEAVRLQPYNWVLLNEVAMFLIFAQREVKAGIDLAKLALAQNPNCAADLWNTLGDGLYEWGRFAEARSAYHKALAVNESDIRARYNLAWVHLVERDEGAALQRLAEAVVLDKTGYYRERLLAKQHEALAHLNVRHQREHLLLINLVSRFAQTPGPDRDTARRAEGAVRSG